MKYSEFIQTVAEVAYLQSELKKRTMVYQVMAKESIAQLVGLPVDSLYHISYEDYRSISSLVQTAKVNASNYYDLFEDEVKEYYRNNMDKMIFPGEAIVMGDIWAYYFMKNPVDLTVIKNSCNMAIDNMKSIC